MTAYNTGSDVANTAVRAFLTKVGESFIWEETLILNLAEQKKIGRGFVMKSLAKSVHIVKKNLSNYKLNT